MAEEENQKKENEPTEEQSQETVTEEPNKETTQEKKEGGPSSIEFLVMMSVGLFLDFLTLFCVPFILLGVGLVVAKIVYSLGLSITTIYAAVKSGTISPAKAKLGEKIMNPLENFFKEQWKKLAFRAVPGIGDVAPGMWTWIIYGILKGKGKRAFKLI